MCALRNLTFITFVQFGFCGHSYISQCASPPSNYSLIRNNACISEGARRINKQKHSLRAAAEGGCLPAAALPSAGLAPSI